MNDVAAVPKALRGFRKIRREWEASFGPSYVEVHDKENGCVYCGQDGKAGRDHVPPLALVAQRKVPEGPRWCYPACFLCNEKLAAYPASCLMLRAEFLLCVLRREWLLVKGGKRSRWRPEHVARNGVSVKARLASGETRALCRCGRCQRLPVLLLTNPLLCVGRQGEA